MEKRWKEKVKKRKKNKEAQGSEKGNLSEQREKENGGREKSPALKTELDAEEKNENE